MSSEGTPKLNVTPDTRPTTRSRWPLATTGSSTRRPSAESARVSPRPRSARPRTMCGAMIPPARKPTTLTSRTDFPRMVERNRTTGSARTTPGAAATSSARPAGITDAVVNGPELPAATTQASVPNRRTMRWFSLVRLELAPESRSVMAKTSAVAATAIVNRRRRHWRSRTLTRHTSDDCLHLHAWAPGGAQPAPGHRPGLPRGADCLWTRAILGGRLTDGGAPFTRGCQQHEHDCRGGRGGSGTATRHRHGRDRDLGRLRDRGADRHPLPPLARQRRGRRQGGGDTVTMAQIAFKPTTLVVARGAEVSFVNKDTAPTRSRRPVVASTPACSTRARRSRSR